MAEVRYEPDPIFEAEMRMQPSFRIAMLDQATVAKGLANAFAREFHAPWMPRRGHGQVVEVQQDADEVFLVNTDYAGVIEEFGSKNNPPHAPLRRAVRAAGLELRETPRPH